ncbi:MAG: alpha/beta hydrolase [Pedobacter sp.]|nr:MAG: alpha/beta hydrolase [Pedobacter sp.]
MQTNKQNIITLAGTIAIVAGALTMVGCSKIINTFFVKNYTDPWHKKVAEAGFAEKTVQIGQVTLNYAEGPENGPALLLLHAQMMNWYSYSRVLPELSKSFHVFAVDYPGQGKTTAPVDIMTANGIGNVLATFMETKINKPAYVSGNSSGGLLTVWLAANKPELVKAIVLEDPPLFSAEYPRVRTTIAYKSFTTCHNYVSTGRKDDFLIYWLESSKPFIEKQAGKKAFPMILSSIKTYQKANPGKPIEIRYLPAMIRIIIRGLSEFDPHFGDAFYKGSWNKDFDHAEALKKIKCPALLLQANFEILPDGILDGAMTKEDADRAVSLIPHGEYRKIDANHVVHLNKPAQFIQIINRFFLHE